MKKEDSYFYKIKSVSINNIEICGEDVLNFKYIDNYTEGINIYININNLDINLDSGVKVKIVLVCEYNDNIERYRTLTGEIKAIERDYDGKKGLTTKLLIIH